MSLLKRRPDVRLLAPSIIVAGRPFRVLVVLRCRAPVPVDAVRVELVGNAVWSAGEHRHTLPLHRYVAQPLASPTALPAGAHELPVSFELPVDAPNSYAGRQLSVEWLVRVHVDIPWWPDVRASFVLFVAGSDASADAPQSAKVFATSITGPQGQRPYAEASLGSTVVEAGGVVRGRVALANTASNDYRALRLSLVAVETMATGLMTSSQHDVLQRWTVPLSSPQDDVPVDLALLLRTTGLVPGFRTPDVSLAWGLEIRIDTAWALDTKLWIPLEVRAPRHAATAEVAVPQPVGAERLARVWAAAAHDSGWSYAAGVLRHEAGDHRLEIRREHQGRGGLRLRGEVGLRALDLGLRVDGGRLRCRDPGQARVLAEHTDALAGACEITEADDERIVCTVVDPGFRREPVVELARRLEALARAFWAAHERLPPPADMADAVPGFRAAARRLGGELEVASMSIRGVCDELRFSLSTQWGDDGTVARMVVEARPTLPVDGRWHQRWDGHGEPGPMPEGLAELAAAAQGVIVGAGSISLVFPPCRGDPEPLVASLEGLLAVARRLSGHGLGYR